MAELQKAKILVYKDTPPPEEIPCLFNPSQYTIRDGVKYAKKPEQGKDDTDSQYMHGEGAVLTLSLYFDTTGELSHLNNQIAKETTQAPVTNFTEKIAGLLRVAGELHRPPVIAFVWGNLNFRGVLTSLNQEFTYFGIDGRPLRAKLDLTISSVPDETGAKKSPFESPDRTKYRTLVQGMSLWKLAYEEYGDAERWREIARANHLMNPLDAKTGQVLKIPAWRQDE